MHQFQSLGRLNDILDTTNEWRGQMRMYFYLSLFSHHACKYAKSKNGYGL